MKLSNIESRKLLPRFASKIAWLMDALDSIIKPISERVKSIDAPLTLESIQACTNEELEALYDQYGVAQYYPDLSREIRNMMLYEMCKIYRYLGTPHAIELLCNYIFDNVPLNVHVLDNLAFDEHGTLIDASLLDVFDIEVNPELPVLSEDATARLIANIIRFSRNSQALRDIIYTFTENFELPVYPMRAGVPGISVENDAICEPVTPPAPAYTEITLYMQSGNKQAQGGVTSSYTGNVNSSYCYQLYTDAGCTTPWTGYDYSNDYELGRYVDGVWTPRVRQYVSDMPATTTGNYDYVFARILMDTGQLWHVTNYQLTGTTSNATLIVRIYPKGQQQYPLYFSQNSNTYNNYSTSGGMVYRMKHRPGTLSYGWMPWSDSFPERTIVNALYSSGKSGVSISRLSFDGTDDIRIKTASGYAPSFRNVIFTLDVPTYTSWANLSGNKSAESNEACPLFDKNGEYVVYDPTMSYTIIGLFNYSGGHPFSSPNRFMLDAQLGAFDTNNPTRLCFKLNRAVTFSYVWYIKEVINPIETTFGAAVTIPAGYHVESVTCSRGYAFATDCSRTGLVLSYKLLGEGMYFDDTNTSLIGAGVNPCLQIATQGNGLALSYKGGTAPSNAHLTFARASNVNSGGYLVISSVTFTNETYASYAFADLIASPVYFNLSDGSGNWLYFCFRVPQTLWQFQNGTFTWLGDTTDTSDLAYWYNGRAVQITLAKDE